MAVISRSSRRRAATVPAFLAAALTLAAQSAGAQSSSAVEKILANTPNVATDCSGPLGSLLPECQAGKAGITIPLPAQSGMGAAIPNVVSRDAETKPAREPG